MFCQSSQQTPLVKVTMVALLSLVLAPAFAFGANPATSVQEYAVKFVCGIPKIEAEREAVKPGNYATAVNIHNPNQKTGAIKFSKHAVLSLPEDMPPQPPGKVVQEALKPDFAMEVDCQNIRDLLHLQHDTTFIKGFLVIVESSTLAPLDVVGVYSSEPPQGQNGISGMGLQIVPITPKTVSQ